MLPAPRGPHGGDVEESRRTYLALSAVPPGARAYEVGVRVTVLPVGHGGGIFIDKVYARPELKGLIEEPYVLVDGAQDGRYLPGWPELPRLDFHPVLRGGQRAYRETSNTEGQNRILAETIHSDGLIEFVYKHGQRQKPLYRGWVMAMVVNGLWLADVMRKYTGVPAAELILDVELSAQQFRADPYRGEPAEFLLQGPEEDRTLWKQLGPNPVRLPLLSATAADDFPAVLLQALNDLRNLGGWKNADHLDIQFKERRRR